MGVVLPIRQAWKRSKVRADEGEQQLTLAGYMVQLSDSLETPREVQETDRMDIDPPTGGRRNIALGNMDEAKKRATGDERGEHAVRPKEGKHNSTN